MLGVAGNPGTWKDRPYGKCRRSAPGLSRGSSRRKKRRLSAKRPDPKPADPQWGALRASLPQECLGVYPRRLNLSCRMVEYLEYYKVLDILSRYAIIMPRLLRLQG